MRLKIETNHMQLTQAIRSLGYSLRWNYATETRQGREQFAASFVVVQLPGKTYAGLGWYNTRKEAKEQTSAIWCPLFQEWLDEVAPLSFSEPPAECYLQIKDKGIRDSTRALNL
ncbi:hypothetical protein CPB86DRAFT_783587 [Serendipita vermifera]|nr:hypothetical protein CPB86DRAFT_783587 [Serendipita vermifera]